MPINYDLLISYLLIGAISRPSTFTSLIVRKKKNIAYKTALTYKKKSVSKGFCCFTTLSTMQ